MYFRVLDNILFYLPLPISIHLCIIYYLLCKFLYQILCNHSTGLNMDDVKYIIVLFQVVYTVSNLKFKKIRNYFLFNLFLILFSFLKL